MPQEISFGKKVKKLLPKSTVNIKKAPIRKKIEKKESNPKEEIESLWCTNFQVMNSTNFKVF